MPRFFSHQVADGTARIIGEDARHIALSLRCRPGEELTVCDGQGQDYLCRIQTVAPEEVELEVLSQKPSGSELPVRVTLYQAMPKGDKLDLIVQKAVELGAWEIVPVLTSRCVSRPDGRSAEKKRERLQRIALEAAKQSGRGRIPQVQPLLSWHQALEAMSRDPLALFFYEQARQPLGPLLRKRPETISLMIGPEGGFSQEEAEEARSAGLAVCSMGPRILRCETAPLYALSAIAYTYENWEESQL